MNPTDAYRKQIRKREIKRVSYRIQFFRKFGGLLFFLICCMISIGSISLLFIVCFGEFNISSGG